MIGQNEHFPLLSPAKVVEVDLAKTLDSISGLEGYRCVWALVRLGREIVGGVVLPIYHGACPASEVALGIAEELEAPLCEALARIALRHGLDHWQGNPSLADLRKLAAVEDERVQSDTADLTLAICTRNRPADLRRCLDSISALDPRPTEVLVVDNAPSDEAASAVAGDYPAVRYVREDRRGLNWARNRAIDEATSEIIGFVDDDTVVDKRWAGIVSERFQDTRLAAMCGSVVPSELETRAQLLFEEYGGFCRGFETRGFQVEHLMREDQGRHLAAGAYGTGANMAFRRNLFAAIGGFDEALDVGTETQGGGDLEMFFRVVHEGYSLLYDPAAMVWHRHRRSYEELKLQLATWGSGGRCYFTRVARRYPELAPQVRRALRLWILSFYVKPYIKRLIRPDSIPRELFSVPLRETLVSSRRYQRAVQAVERFAVRGENINCVPAGYSGRSPRRESKIPGNPIELLHLDAASPSAIRSAAAIETPMRVFVRFGSRMLGQRDLNTTSGLASPALLSHEIARSWWRQILGHPPTKESLADAFTGADCDTETVPQASSGQQLLYAPSIGVVVATLGERPEQLCRCLRSLLAQNYRGDVRIVVVDNCPESGETQRVLCEFPGVEQVAEVRRGLAIARNTGFRRCMDLEIVATTDDDVIAPEGWLRQVAAKFARHDVIAMTGNVLPDELSPPQLLFEDYGGLGKGFTRFEVNERWLTESASRPPRTWDLGATANAAFRTTALADPLVNGMDERLGPGLATGAGEDTYLFYRLLRRGGTLVYDPSAYVTHAHRSDMRDLTRQLFCYSKGHVAYLLMTLFLDGDLRALNRLLVRLPRWHLIRLLPWTKRMERFPRWLVLVELAGNMLGPVALAWTLIWQRRSFRHFAKSPPRADHSDCD